VDYFIEKGNYIKPDMLSLGYTLDLDNKWINKIRVYGTVRNLFTITAFGGIDPAQYPTNGLTPGTFNGNWLDGQLYHRQHYHTWTIDDGAPYNSWFAMFQGVMLCSASIRWL
jgi:hypothetical protein